MSTIGFTQEQVTQMLEILQQNGLLNAADDIMERANSLLQPHIRAPVKATQRTTRVKSSVPIEELQQLNCQSISECHCKARKWGCGTALGWGGQCTSKQQMGSDFCAKHGTTKLSKKSCDGPDGSCLPCSKAQGKTVKHIYNWEHMGRYIPGEVTLGPKWKCDTQLVGSINIQPASEERDDEVEYFDTKSVEQLQQALDGELAPDDELTHAVEAAIALEGEDWLRSYITGRQTQEQVGVSSPVSSPGCGWVSGSDDDGSDGEASGEHPLQSVHDPVNGGDTADTLSENLALIQEPDEASDLKAKQEQEAIALKAKQEAEAAVALKAKQEADAASILKAKQEAEAASILKARLAVKTTSTPLFASDDESDEDSDEDSDDESDEEEDERPSRWATGGFMEISGKMVGWVKETGDAFFMDPITMGKDGRYGSFDAETGEMTPTA